MNTCEADDTYALTVTVLETLQSFISARERYIQEI